VLRKSLAVNQPVTIGWALLDHRVIGD
jgi:hypothetical protein